MAPIVNQKIYIKAFQYCICWNINIRTNKFLYKKINGSVVWNKEGSINQKSNNTQSVMLGTRATFVKKTPS